MAADADIVSTFSLLPHLFRLSKTISAKQTDPQQQAQLIQNVISDLQTQLQRCHQLLEVCPGLDHTPEEHIALLDRRKRELKQKCDLLHKYKDLSITQ